MIAVVLFPVCLNSQLAYADVNRSIFIDIPSQDLTSALIELGKLTELSLIITSSKTKYLVAPRILGTMPPRDAIAKLLEGSGLVYEIINAKIVSIEEPQTKPREPRELYPGKLEFVNVVGYKLTGSNIRRFNAEDGLAPLDILSETEIERSGSETLADLIKFIPAVSGNSTSTSVSNGGDGTTKVTLRGLPANNTLVLINGQRVGFDGLAGDSVDLNTIAPAAIQRMEILKDGASAIYGSDAIAGVMNIVMKEAFNGVRVAHYTGQSSRLDLETHSSSLLIGNIGRQHNGMLALTYYQQDGLFSRDREISESADNRSQGGADKRVSATPYTRLTDNDGQALILNTDANGEALPGTSPEHFRLATSEDLFDYRTQTSSISPSERVGAYGSLTNSFSDSLQLRSFVLASNTDATITLASAPLYTAFTDEPVTVSAENQYNPFGEDIADVRRRVVELGPRTQRNTSKNFHLNSVFEYLKPGFEWSSGIYWNQTIAKQHRQNLIDGTRLPAALGTAESCLGLSIDGCTALNLFGPPGSIDADQLDYISTNQRSLGTSTLYGLNSSISGTIQALESKQILYATGIEWRSESSEFKPDELARDNLVGGVFQSSTSGKRKVIEVYGELFLPLISNVPQAKKLDLELAARYTHSSDYGDNIAPKLGLKYLPFDGLTLRSTLSSGFRAPSIKELYTSGDRSYASIYDPCSLEENVGQLQGCTQQSDSSLSQFLTEYSGFAELDPEESVGFTIGFFCATRKRA